MKFCDSPSAVYDSRTGKKFFFRRAGRKSKIRNSEAAFTMIEIAIALAVIAFALVAIIGVLPTGLNVQKDNREDTIINQDGPYWIEAIRNGSKGLDQLTGSVERIGIVLIDLKTNTTTIHTNYDAYDFAANKNGSNIVGLLSIPKGSLFNEGGTTSLVVRVEAQVRALTGSATEQGLANPDFAFSYLLVSEIVPFQFFAEDTTNYVRYTNSYPSEWLPRSNRWTEARYLPANSHESRLTFRWPYLGEGKTGPGRQLFRSVIAGQLRPENVISPGNPLYFFQPQTYVQQ